MSIFDKRSSEKSRPQDSLAKDSLAKDSLAKDSLAKDAPLAGSADFEFQAAAASHRMIALWAAEKMGLSGQNIENYARAVVRGPTEQPSEEDVIRKILGDLVASNITVRESEVRTKAAEFLAQAREALKS